MDLLGLILSLTVPFGPGAPRPNVLDISPTVGIGAPIVNRLGAAGMALPFAVLHGSEDAWIMTSSGPARFDRHDKEYLREELNHGIQQRALGPGFWPAYFLTGGEPFEPYDIRSGGKKWLGMDHMWMPEPEQREQFPIFRLQWGGGKPTQFHFMPGYPGITLSREGLRWR